MPADWTPLGAEDWRESFGPRAQLDALLQSNLTSALAVEVALGLRAGAIDRYLAGEDVLTEAEEIALMKLLEDYRGVLRRVNAERARDRLRAP